MAKPATATRDRTKLSVLKKYFTPVSDKHIRGRRVKVRIVSATDKFDSQYSLENGKARIVMRGKLDADEVIKLRRDLDRIIAARPERIVLVVKELETISRQGMNELLFFRSKVAMGEDVYVVGACEGVAAMFVEIGDTEAAGGDFCRVDDESEVPD